MLRPGDLVIVEKTEPDAKPDHGVVLEYNPDVYGGSSIISYKIKGGWKQEVVNSPRRGEVLVRSYADGGVSWYDEFNVRAFEDVVE